MTAMFTRLTPVQRNAAYMLAAAAVAANFRQPSRLPMTAEQLAEAYIAGDRPAFGETASLVAQYRQLAVVTRKCASYPRSVDDQMNALYDSIVEACTR